MHLIKKHEEIIVVSILVLANLLVKGIFLSSNSLGGDEPFSVYHAQMNIASIIRLLSEGNNPPLYEVLLHFWVKLFGITELSVRFPSLIFSTLTVIYLYKFGISFLNKRIAIYASLIFIFSNYQILFAHEARVYALLGMLSIISAYYFMHILKYIVKEMKENSGAVLAVRNKLIILLVIDTLIIYSHYFGFLILITQFLFVVFSSPIRSRYWKQLLLSIGIIGVLYAPNILVLINRFIASSSAGTWVNPPNGLESIYNMLRQFSNAPVVTVFVIAVLFLSFVKYIRNIKKEEKNSYSRFIIFWFLFIFFFMFGSSYFVPMFLDRYLMPAAIVFSLVVGIALDYLIQRPIYNYIIPFIISVLFIVTVKPNITNKRNVKETVAKVKELKDPNTLVLICPAHFSLTFSYYYNIDYFKDYNTEKIYSNIQQSLNSEHIYAINSMSEVDFKKWDKIVYLDAAANFSAPNNDILTQLDAHYTFINKTEFYEIFNVFEYSVR